MLFLSKTILFYSIAFEIQFWGDLDFLKKKFYSIYHQLVIWDLIWRNNLNEKDAFGEKKWEEVWLGRFDQGN